MLSLMVVSCSKDESDDVVETNISNISAEWVVTDINEGNGWTPIDSSEVILSEDGFYMILGRICLNVSICRGRYTLSDNTVVLRENDSDLTFLFQFKEVRQRTATATLISDNGNRVELRMHRDESRPLCYKDSTTFLRGRWNMIAHKTWSDNTFTPDTDGFAIFDGDNATLQIHQKTYRSKYHRFSVLGVVSDEESFIIIQGDASVEILINIKNEILSFRKQ